MQKTLREGIECIVGSGSEMLGYTHPHCPYGGELQHIYNFYITFIHILVRNEYHISYCILQCIQCNNQTFHEIFRTPLLRVLSRIPTHSN